MGAFGFVPPCIGSRCAYREAMCWRPDTLAINKRSPRWTIGSLEFWSDFHSPCSCLRRGDMALTASSIKGLNFMTVLQRIRRIRCWWRYYHVGDASHIYKFRYDVSGVCHDCGRVSGSVVPTNTTVGYSMRSIGDGLERPCKLDEARGRLGPNRRQH